MRTGTAVLFLTSVFLAAATGSEASSVDSTYMFLWRGEYGEAASMISEAGPDYSGLDDFGRDFVSDKPFDGASLSDILTYLFVKIGNDSLAFKYACRDTLAAALFSLSRGDTASAMRFLSEPLRGRYSESYRLYHLAKLLYAEGRKEQALDLIKALFRDEDGRAAIRKLPVHVDAVELLIELYLRSEGEDVKELLELVEGELKTSRFHLLLSRVLMHKGEMTGAKLEFMKALGGTIDDCNQPLFVDCFYDLLHAGLLSTPDELFSVALNLIRVRAMREAELVMRRISKNRDCRERYMYLRGEYLAASGDLRGAIRTLRAVFDSKASVEIKRNALWRIAGIKYSMSKLRDSAASYRMFASYYPGDYRSVAALDRASRIFMVLGRYDEALRLLKALKRKARGRVAAEAALMQCAIQAIRGRRDLAVSALADAATSDWFTAPAIYYWKLHFESSSKNRNLLVKRLRFLFPFSVYSLAANGEDLNLRFSHRGSSEDASSVINLERSERELFEKLIELKGIDYVQDDRLSLVRSVVGAGMLREGAEIAEGFIEGFGGDERLMLSIYLYCRPIGMVGVGFKAVSRLIERWEDADTFRPLQYPVAYSDYLVGSSERWGVPVPLLLALMREESAFNPYAESKAGARGLMQIMPETWDWISSKPGLGKTTGGYVMEDPESSIEVAAWYVNRLLGVSHGSVIGAVAMYNAGEGKMRMWSERVKPWERGLLSLEMIGPKETRSFARRVVDSYSIYRFLARGDSGT